MIGLLVEENEDVVGGVSAGEWKKMWKRLILGV